VRFFFFLLGFAQQKKAQKPFSTAEGGRKRFLSFTAQINL
jgi:hypothetical protein